eukprot:403330904
MESSGTRNNTKILNSKGMLNQTYDSQPNHQEYSTNNNRLTRNEINSNLNNSFEYQQTQSQYQLPAQSTRSGTVGRKDYRKATQLSVFPMYGLWDGKTTFQSQKQIDQSYQAKLMQERRQGESASYQKNKDELNVDRGHFRKVYFEKTYMEELLKMKNMMGKVKK